MQTGAPRSSSGPCNTVIPPRYLAQLHLTSRPAAKLTVPFQAFVTATRPAASHSYEGSGVCRQRRQRRRVRGQPFSRGQEVFAGASPLGTDIASHPHERSGEQPPEPERRAARASHPMRDQETFPAVRGSEVTSPAIPMRGQELIRPQLTEVPSSPRKRTEQERQHVRKPYRQGFGIKFHSDRVFHLGN